MSLAGVFPVGGCRRSAPPEVIVVVVVVVVVVEYIHILIIIVVVVLQITPAGFCQTVQLESFIFLNSNILTGNHEPEFLVLVARFLFLCPAQHNLTFVLQN